MDRLSWTASQQRCQLEGGILASVPDQGTREFLASLYLASTIMIHSMAVKKSYWIGGKKIAGSYQWSDGTPFTYNGFSKECLIQLKDTGKLSDDYCSNDKPFVCQLPAAGSTGNYTQVDSRLIISW